MAETYINAQDLVEDVSLDGEEQFVMFDTEAGRRAKLKNIKEYINDQEYAKQASTAGEAVVATQLLGDQFRKDTALYTCRKTGGGKSVDKAEIIDKITGGSVAWNQQVTNPNLDGYTGVATREGTVVVENGVVTFTPTTAGTERGCKFAVEGAVGGHKYFSRVNMKPTVGGTVSIGINGGSNAIRNITANAWNDVTAILNANSTLSPASASFYQYNSISSTDTIQYKEPTFIDLTQMLGSTIADYIYSLEQANAGAGVAWFRQYFLNSYYEYNAGAIKSVEGLSAHRTKGFNQWDEEWEVGAISESTGQNYASTTRIRSKNYISVLPSTTYYFMATSGTTYNLFYYDEAKNFISVTGHTAQRTFTTPSNARYVRFYRYTEGILYSNDICINISSDINGEYEPSNHRSYALDSSLVLRGMPQVVDGKLTYDGDEYFPSGRVNRKYGVVTYDGSESGWTWTDGYLQASIELPSVAKYDGYTISYTCNRLTPMYNQGRPAAIGNYASLVSSGANAAFSAPNCDTLAKFKTWLSSNPLQFVYELATPTIEQAKPYTSMQACSQEGIEEFVYLDGNVNIPVMAETRYPVDRATRADETTVLAADQLRSNSYTEESVPYRYRKAGGDVIAGGVKDECIVGGSVAWNQLIDFEHPDSGNYGTYSNGVLTYSGTNPFTLYMSNKQINEGHKLFLYADYDATATGGDLVQCFTINGQYIYIQSGTKTHSGVYAAIVNKNSTSSSNSLNFALWQGEPYQGQTVTVRSLMLIDLTQMFGSTVADYIYNLEQSSAGAGVALFRSMFPESYYEYNAGGLSSVEGLQKHVTTGFNQWDEEWELGSISSSGQPESSAYRIRTKNYIPVLPNTTYYIKWGTYGSGRGAFYDADKNLIWYSSDFYRNQTFTTPQNARYMKFSPSTDYGTTYKNDICINLSGDRNGEYEPYKKHSYALDSSIVLRGVPKVVNGKICFDGDEYYPDGRVKRKFSVTTINRNSGAYGNYAERTNTVRIIYNGITDIVPNNSNVSNIMQTNDVGLPTLSPDAVWSSDVEGVCELQNPSMTGIIISVNKSRLSEVSVNGLYSWIDAHPITIVYKKVISTTETADAYVGTQACDEYGIEEYISTSICPVGHKTKYYDNLTKRITKLPSTIAPVERSAISSANYAVGDYLILNNTLYKVTSAITTGGTITPGSNVTATTIMAEIKALR